MIDSSFWRERRVFVTGHTGFRGAWLSLMLERLAARVTGYGLAPATGPSLYELARVGDGLCDVRGDVCDAAMLDGALRAADPDVVIHLAARSPHGGAGFKAGLERLRATGASEVLDATLRAPSVQAAIFVAADPAYISLDWADLAPMSDMRVVSLHCPRVVGGGAQEPCVDARPLHALDALYGVLLLAERACAADDGFARAWSFGRETHASRIEAAGWSPLLGAAETQIWTREWNDALAAGADMRAFAREQVDRYLGQRVRLTSPFVRGEEAPLRYAMGA